MSELTDKKRKCSYLLPDPGGKVLREELDIVDKLEVEAARLETQLAEARKKWQDYERDYILPAFEWAVNSNIDLRKLVADNPGRNCVELLVKALQAENARLTALVGFYDKRLGEDLLTRAYKGALEFLPDEAAKQSSSGGASALG